MTFLPGLAKSLNSFTRMLEMMLEKQAHIHNSQGKMVQPLCREIWQLHITYYINYILQTQIT